MPNTFDQRQSDTRLMSLYYRDEELHEFRIECSIHPYEKEVELCRQILIDELIHLYGSYKKPVLAVILGGGGQA